MDSPFQHVVENEAHNAANGHEAQGSRSHDRVHSYGAPTEVTIEALHEGSFAMREDEPQLTFRAVGTGLVVGSLLCCSNTYFGLQTGWVTMGSLQSAVLGFGIFRVLERYGITSGLSVAENVILQTTSVATATMPLAAGLVGIIPALGMMTPRQNPPLGPIVLSPGQLLLWSLGLAFFGVFIAVPLRTQTIIKEKLRFPSGTATAKVIRMLHGGPTLADDLDGPVDSRRELPPVLEEDGEDLGSGKERAGDEEQAREVHHNSQRSLRSRASIDVEERQPLIRRSSAPALCLSGAASLARADSTFGVQALQQLESQGVEDEGEWARAWAALLWTFVAAAAYTLAASQLPWLRSFPILSWVGLPAATAWGWEVAPAMGYMGQGMIMGPKTALSMFGGAVLGYGILGPYARAQGWAPGEIMDWKNGATGWILWVSLAIMLGDSLTSLSLLVITSTKCTKGSSEEAERERDGCQPIPTSWWVGGLAASTVLCTAVMVPLLGLRLYEPAAAVAVALLVAVLAVRALGQTDLNPVSGVGKLSQVVFALIAPKQVVPNLVAGAIAEAGANQAGDMMQACPLPLLSPNACSTSLWHSVRVAFFADFKTAHLLGVCPRAQFAAMLLGSAVSAGVSVAAYSLYTSAWQVPGPDFPAPTAEIWLDMADLVNGGQLPPHVVPFCVVAAAVAACLPLTAFFLQRARLRLQLEGTRPQNVAQDQWRRRLLAAAEVALPSGVGVAVGLYAWRCTDGRSHKRMMVIVASGLVLGEGTASIVTASLRAAFG
ncbi:OPT superfamily oligopeptide transporter [Coccomyxa subellipsoidea C-169]|uniref:OPT superfamily oligopeptide transporter n=1 Tax=Coccomyxa subellipsoidea (strain C-169) TaxID=574566 RepID=I0YNF9_COCSC|nr:OPT superfamily oligopeptide transporter [Coccomyxa subellipsoidea C-169]EIE19928.1 OPT superfamily oligopeptide transporter [Coccomyxa subellipsoidea C-169]|eukprot:XP_005644472.1 OPT superfamily oligopeptide transporter [Coccomyxa subellipsoidea C-169]